MKKIALQILLYTTTLSCFAQTGIDQPTLGHLTPMSSQPFSLSEEQSKALKQLNARNKKTIDSLKNNESKEAIEAAFLDMVLQPGNVTRRDNKDGGFEALLSNEIIYRTEHILMSSLKGIDQISDPVVRNEGLRILRKYSHGQNLSYAANLSSIPSLSPEMQTVVCKEVNAILASSNDEKMKNNDVRNTISSLSAIDKEPEKRGEYLKQGKIEGEKKLQLLEKEFEEKKAEINRRTQMLEDIYKEAVDKRQKLIANNI